MFTQNIAEAILFAKAAHGSQRYGQHEYIVHPENVVQVIKIFSDELDESLIIAGYLHDTIEDTPTSYSDIKKKFGAEPAELVYAVTDELGRNRAERHVKTYPKIAANKKAIALKLADRISNVAYSIANRESRFLMYLKEHDGFKQALSNGTHKAMWDQLEKLFLQGVALNLDKVT